jgi:hypothetical protein
MEMKLSRFFHREAGMDSLTPFVRVGHRPERRCQPERKGARPKKQGRNPLQNSALNQLTNKKNYEPKMYF